MAGSALVRGLPAVGDDEPRAPAPARLWWTLALLALLLRMAVMPFGGYPSDIASFKGWAAALAQAGPQRFYGDAFVDYLPGYLYVLWGIGVLQSATRLNDQALLFALKLPAALADVATAAVIWTLARRRVSDHAALLPSAAYLFHPGLIFAGAYWGQTDAVGMFLQTAALMLYAQGTLLTWPAAALAFLVKPQTLPFLLALAVVQVREAMRPPDGSPPRPLVPAAAAVLGLATITAYILPFRLGWIQLFALMRRAADVYPYSSVMAYNIWGAVHGFWREDGVRALGLPLVVWGSVAAGLALVAVLATVWRRPDERTLVCGGAAALLAVFTLATRMHERYLLFALPLLAVGLVHDRRIRAVFLAMSLLLVHNLIYAYTRPAAGTFLLPGWLEAGLFSEAAARVFSAATATLLPWMLWILWDPPRTPAD